jgi:hypothetical protein
MIPDTRALVRSVLTRCAVDPPRGFEWFGQWIPIAASTREDQADEIFLRTLTLHLYLHVFCPGEVTARLPTLRASRAGEIRALMTAHSLANPDRDRWDTGWTYVGSSRDSHLVRGQGLDFTASAEGVRPRHGSALRVGCDVEVLVPAERWSLSPGYMLFYGKRLLPPRSAGIRRTRLYLDLDVEDARRVIGMCRRFNEARIPFTLKVAGQPAVYDERCDTVILFVERDDYRRASELLVEEATRAGLRPRPPVPGFTRRLGSGLAVADDPAVPESFGESRCRLLASGILRAHEAGENTLKSKLEEIEAAFLAEGVRLDSTHLEPGSEEYETDPWSHWPAP